MAVFGHSVLVDGHASFTVGSDKADDHLARLRTLVAPSVPRSVLHHRVACPKMHFYTIVQFQPDLARNDILKVKGVRRVHARMVRLHVGRAPHRHSVPEHC